MCARAGLSVIKHLSTGKVQILILVMKENVSKISTYVRVFFGSRES